MFKISNTWKKISSPTSQNRGSPAPGDGAQQTGNYRKPPDDEFWTALIKYAGEDTYFNPSTPVNAQRGSPAPEGPGQSYRPGEVTSPRVDGHTYYRETRNFSRGAQAFAPTTGIVLSTPNPGARVTNKPRVVPNYPLGQYVNHTIFWANQIVPTTIKLSGLQTEEAIDELLSQFVVYGSQKAL